MSRLEAELVALERLVADPMLSASARAAALLTIHQRRDAPGGCICGWFKLGASFARHQADALAEAGLLARSRNALDAGGSTDGND
jgi:hypothetical protein